MKSSRRLSSRRWTRSRWYFGFCSGIVGVALLLDWAFGALPSAAVAEDQGLAAREAGSALHGSEPSSSPERSSIEAVSDAPGTVTLRVIGTDGKLIVTPLVLLFGGPDLSSPHSDQVPRLDGLFELEGVRAGQLVVAYHPSHSAASLVLSAASEQTLVLPERPRITCEVQGLTPNALSTHELLAVAYHDPRRDQLLEIVRKRRPGSLSAPVPLDSRGMAELSLPSDGEVDVEVQAWRRGAGGRRLVATSRVSLQPPLRGKSAIVWFLGGLPEAYGSPKLSINFPFPEAVGLEVAVLGPLAAVDPVLVRGLQIQRSGSGLANEPLDLLLDDVPHGLYSVRVTASDFGTYELGPLQYAGEDRLSLSGPIRYVSCRLTIPPLDGAEKDADVAILDRGTLLWNGRFRTNSPIGLSLLLADQGRYQLRCEVTDGSLAIRPSTFRCTTNGIDAPIFQWVQQHAVMVETSALQRYPVPRMWLTMQDLTSGLETSTGSFAPGRAVPLKLCEGSHMLRAYVAGEPAWDAVVRVPECGGVVRIP